MFLVLLFFVGLATDAGLIYVNLTVLRRGVDSASLGAAAQFREAATLEQMAWTAVEFVQLQGLDPTTVVVTRCDNGGNDDGFEIVDVAAGTGNTVAGDADLCTTPARKLVRVTARTLVNFAFVPLLGFDNIEIAASATSEAAPLEIVLILDTSESMIWDARADDGDDDDGDTIIDDNNGCTPACTSGPNEDHWLGLAVDPLPLGGPDRVVTCNTVPAAAAGIPGLLPSTAVDSCRPFEWVRDAALGFVGQFVQFPFDRVSIINFANTGTVTQSLNAPAPGAGSESLSNTQTVLNLLDVTPNFGHAECDPAQYSTAPGPCEATNIGHAQALAKQELDQYARQGALRFIILLSDGETSTGTDFAGTWYCPNSPATDPDFSSRRCTDGDGAVRHASGSPDYDADDYARDQADLILADGNTIMFTIGLGDAVTSNPGTGNPDGLPNGEQLLRYIADQGDGSTAIVCGRDANFLYQATIGTSCGNYFFAQGGLDLEGIFNEIADRIFTRLTQ